MKKYTIIGYITLIILIIMMGFIFYKVYANQNKNDNIQEKTFGEIKKLDSNFSNIFNQLNNVKYEQYKISSSEMKEDDKGSSAENTAPVLPPQSRPRRVTAAPGVRSGITTGQ